MIAKLLTWWYGDRVPMTDERRRMIIDTEIRGH